jgi:hypothetical protein
MAEPNDYFHWLGEEALDMNELRGFSGSGRNKLPFGVNARSKFPLQASCLE